jgi:hypothetical protein
VYAVFLSADRRYALSKSTDETLKLWALDWELQQREPTDRDEAARPYLEVFGWPQGPCPPPAPHGNGTEKSCRLLNHSPEGKMAV